MFDVIVIGAGYGGMSVAALLGFYGRRVLVIEESALVGGRAHSYTDEEGYTWEYGAHSHRLAELGIANQVFKRLGDAIEFLPEAGGGKLILRGRLWDRPAGPVGFLTTPMLSLKARAVLIALLIKIKRARPVDWYDTTLLDFYRTWFRNKEVEEFLAFFGMTVMCPDPAKASAGEVIEFLQRALAAGIGVGEPARGSRQLFEKLERHIVKRGAIRLKEKATGLVIENGAVTGVRTDQGTYAAPRVVFAARLPLLFGLAERARFDPDFVNYVDVLENSSSLTIDFILNKAETSVRGGILGIDIPIWARFQSVTDLSFTPKGRFLSTWGIMLPWGFDGDPIVVAETETKLKATIRKLFPGFLPTVVKERKTVVPIMNGTVLTPAQSKPHRPRVVCDTVKGLYFVGDTVKGDGCSGDISFSSALKVADLILAESPGPLSDRLE